MPALDRSPTACPRRGGSAIGHPDRLPASDRWLTGRPDLLVPPSPKLPRHPLPRPAARSRLPEEERRLPGRPTGDPIQPRPSPQADPLPIATPSAPSAPPGTAPWVPRPQKPHRPCRGIAGSRTDSVPSGRCPYSRIGGTGKSESPESWHSCSVQISFGSSSPMIGNRMEGNGLQLLCLDLRVQREGGGALCPLRSFRGMSLSLFGYHPGKGVGHGDRR